MSREGEKHNASWHKYNWGQIAMKQSSMSFYAEVEHKVKFVKLQTLSLVLNCIWLHVA